ncbi:MAG TPA: hypothetical protein VJV79_39855 [Polyangiaceae bacterium]|nr:hypothetical protein [Polyangiaceae bacterium]
MRALVVILRLLSIGAVALTLANSARAAEPVGERFPDPKPPLALLPTPDDALMDPRMARSWATLPPRKFIATTVDIGFVYLRPRLSLGYGRPFTQWIGVDANPIAAQNGLGAYAGLRLEIPHLDFRIGPRYFASFNHTYLPQQSSYSRLDLESNLGSPSRTLTFEAELDLNVVLGPGRLLLRGSASYVSGVPDGYSAFEETLHIIVDPPLVWRTRLAYAVSFGGRKQHSIGGAVDLLDVPKRDDSRTIRVGPIVRLALSRRVDVRGSFIFTVVSPDRIGLAGGDFTELGIRYRWASE